MIRIIVRNIDALPDGTRCGSYYETFDVDLPELEKYLSEPIHYGGRWVEGVEVIRRGEGE